MRFVAENPFRVKIQSAEVLEEDRKKSI